MPVSAPHSLLGRLAEHKVEFVLVGGLAGVVHGAPITTFDVDIVHHRTPENVERLLALLSELDAYHRGRPGDQRLPPEGPALLGPGHQLLQTTLGALDVLGAIEDDLAYPDLLQDAARLEIGGRVIRVISLRKLIELKSRSSRAKDRLQLQLLQAALALSDVEPDED